jgi:septum site-determining protein MinD
MLNIEDITDILAIPLLGVIPESSAVLQASNAGAPVTLDKTTDASLAYTDAIDRFLGEEVPMRFITEEKRGILKRLFRLKNKQGEPA